MMTEKFVKVPLDKFSLKNYRNYGIATLEDRAVPALSDGLKPIHRRVIWAAHNLGIGSKSKHVKAARIIGETIGRYSPHGDSSAYGAMVGLTNVGTTINNANKGLFEGEGNWGSFSDHSAAAMRYTEARVSKFADEVLLNKFYLPVIQFGPNFDSSTVEPLELPALLPLVFINGSSGIATGASVEIPRFEYTSVLKTLALIYKGEDITPALLFKNLRFTSLYGGCEKKPQGDQLEARKSVFTTRRGSVVLHADMEFDPAKKSYIVTKFGSNSASAEKLIGKILAVPGVHSCYDDSTKNDIYGTLRFVLKKLEAKAEETCLAKIKTILSSKENFFLNFTNRYIDKDEQLAASVIALSITDAFKWWVDWRIKLEQNACAYWISTTELRIRKIDLLLLAVDNRKLIIESLDKDVSQDALEEWLAKKLDITKAEAAVIYDLRVKQLRKLERKQLEAERKDVISHKAALTKRKNKPQEFMAAQLQEFQKL